MDGHDGSRLVSLQDTDTADGSWLLMRPIASWKLLGILQTLTGTIDRDAGALREAYKH